MITKILYMIVFAYLGIILNNREFYTLTSNAKYIFGGLILITIFDMFTKTRYWKNIKNLAKGVVK
jgi:hypothetical protein